MRPRQHDKFVLIGLCWLYGLVNFLLLLMICDIVKDKRSMQLTIAKLSKPGVLELR